jgi:hypothetical protein
MSGLFGGTLPRRPCRLAGFHVEDLTFEHLTVAEIRVTAAVCPYPAGAEHLVGGLR